MTTIRQLIEKDGKWYGGVEPKLYYPWDTATKWFVPGKNSDFDWFYSVDPATEKAATTITFGNAKDA